MVKVSEWVNISVSHGVHGEVSEDTINIKIFNKRCKHCVPNIVPSVDGYTSFHVCKRNE